MSDDFDPYQKWLGIPPQDQPPNYYRLLTLKPLEPDLGVIERTADKLTAYLEARSQGKNSAHAQRLLDEVAAARQCLLDPESKAVYDSTLQPQQAKRPAAARAGGERAASGGGQAKGGGALDFLHEEPSPPASSRQAVKPAGRAATVSNDRAAGAGPAGDMSFLDDLSFGSPNAAAATSPTVKAAAATGSKAKASTGVLATTQKKPSIGFTTAGKKQGWQPQPWQLGAMIGGGVLVVVAVIAIAMSMQGNGNQGKSPTGTVTRQGPPPDFGPQTVDRAKLQAEQAAKRKIPRNLPSFSVAIHRQGDFFLTAVTINDEPAGNFLLDTGSERTAISPAVADKLKLPEEDKPTRIRGVGGGQTAAYRKSRMLHIGEVRFDNLQLVVIDLTPWEKATGAKFDGVIGCDVWGEMMFCIDPQLEKLTFYDRDRMPRGDSIGELLTELEHRPFIAVRLDDGEELQYMAATGCGNALMLRTGGEPPAAGAQGNAGAATETPSRKISKVTLFGEKFANIDQVPARWDDVYVLKSDPRQAGVVGGHILANFKLVMDIQRHKVAAQRIGGKNAK